MSQKHDTRKTLKLDPEIDSALEKKRGSFTIKPSKARLANQAIKLGLPKVQTV